MQRYHGWGILEEISSFYLQKLNFKRYRKKIISPDTIYTISEERIPTNVLVEVIITSILNESQEINSFYNDIKFSNFPLNIN